MQSARCARVPNYRWVVAAVKDAATRWSLAARTIFAAVVYGCAVSCNLFGRCSWSSCTLMRTRPARVMHPWQSPSKLHQGNTTSRPCALSTIHTHQQPQCGIWWHRSRLQTKTLRLHPCHRYFLNQKVSDRTHPMLSLLKPLRPAEICSSEMQLLYTCQCPRHNGQH